MHSCLKCLHKHIISWFWPDRPRVLVAEILVILVAFDGRMGRELMDSDSEDEVEMDEEL